MSWRRRRNTGTAFSNEPTLDVHSGAAFAFSFRRLRSAYTGPCIQIQRNTDNALLDIGFAGGLLDWAAIEAFIGVNTGRIRNWYDQSGNGRNASNTISAQPEIYTGGTRRQINGIPAGRYNGSTALTVLFDLFNPSTAFSYAMVSLCENASGRVQFQTFDSGINGPYAIRGYYAQNYLGVFSRSGAIETVEAGNPVIGTPVVNTFTYTTSNNAVLYNNNISASLNNISWTDGGLDTMQIGLYAHTTHPANFQGTIAEFIGWPRNNLSSIQDIQAQLMATYSI